MNGSFLIDTNIVIGLFNADPDIVDWLKSVSDVFLCTIVIGELYYGASKSTRKKENIEKLEDFIVTSSVLESDIATAKEYGIIKNELHRKGKPIPENDIWIAVLAKQYNITLYTGDAHFKDIPGVKVLVREVM